MPRTSMIAVVAGGQFGELIVEVLASLLDVREQIFLFDGVDDSDGNGAGERIASEGCAVHAGSEGCGGGVWCRASRP